MRRYRLYTTAAIIPMFIILFWLNSMAGTAAASVSENPIRSKMILPDDEFKQDDKIFELISYQFYFEVNHQAIIRTEHKSIHGEIIQKLSYQPDNCQLTDLPPPSSLNKFCCCP